MISNKEKRLSQVYDVYANQMDGLPPSIGNHHLANNNNNPVHPSSYGMIKSTPLAGSSSGSSCKQEPALQLGKKKALLQGNPGDRNSQSLSHQFSHLYISNLKTHMLHNHSHTQGGKKYDPHGASVLPSLEEMNSHKKEAAQAKKQLMQMEKSISFWSDCTEYWRTKWRKTRDEKSRACDEAKVLKGKVTRLEQQLQASEEKRTRLGEEVNMLHGELSRYLYRFDTAEAPETTNRHRAKMQQPPSAGHFNSDRRVDYRKQRRKKEIPALTSLRRTEMSSTEEEECQRYEVARARAEVPLSKVHSVPRTKGEPPPAPSLFASPSNGTSKVTMRNHERLFDKKIANRKRFSQVVMCDEEELFQFNQDIPCNSLGKSSDTTTLKYSETSHQHPMNQSEQSIGGDTSTNAYQQRTYMEHVLEEEEEEDGHGTGEECFGGEEEEEDSSDQFRRRKVRLLGGESTNGFDFSKGLRNDSNLSSTMATNSECANVGSVRTEDADEDSFPLELSMLNHSSRQCQPKVHVNSRTDGDEEREGIGVQEEEDEDEDDEDEEEDDDEV